ncbi:MAG TPA: NAAT family transporter [Candidatus Omnitrophota bacterium]|nr:NAAT family transporter [Candidatus Omnitrophota bacterium]
MSETFHFFIFSFWSLFVIVDPITVVPVFLSMTGQDTNQDRVRMARLACLVTFFVLLCFSLGGSWILKIFGVTLPAFEIAGGIVLLKIAIDMLQGRRTLLKETPEEEAEGATKEDIAITPLGVPMLAGPGAITAVVLLGSRSESIVQHGIVIANIFLVSLIAFLTLRFAVFRSSIFSTITLKIISRLMGLILAAIAVQFILNGWAKAQAFL